MVHATGFSGVPERNALNALAQHGANRATKRGRRREGPVMREWAARGQAGATGALPAREPGYEPPSALWHQKSPELPPPGSKAEPLQPDTAHTASHGARPLRHCRQVRCRHLQALWRCKHCPRPTVAASAPPPPRPWRTQTTPEPGGPVCGSDAGIAATWNRLWGKPRKRRQREVWQSLTKIKD